jgi:uncharacterized membrane protein
VNFQSFEQRRGAMMIAVLVCITIASMLSLTLVKQLLSRQALLEMTENQVQADWLVEAGIERAVAKLKGEPGYSGETWNITDALDDGRAGRVKIVVRSDPDHSESRTAEVTAEFPADAQRGFQSTKTITIDLPIEGAPAR